MATRRITRNHGDCVTVISATIQRYKMAKGLMGKISLLYKSQKEGMMKLGNERRGRIRVHSEGVGVEVGVGLKPPDAVHQHQRVQRMDWPIYLMKRSLGGGGHFYARIAMTLHYTCSSYKAEAVYPLPFSTKYQQKKRMVCLGVMCICVLVRNGCHVVMSLSL